VYNVALNARTSLNELYLLLLELLSERHPHLHDNQPATRRSALAMCGIRRPTSQGGATARLRADA
jgi:hypothetical protein